ncbi:hypothetical protein SDC9_45395 [bioreactor metagenome]|uniref:Uncharacterized protein n=1 Tax=bioreactor metagenome TaxID=1076179 RepID=A0A644W5Y7_9ZZZZ
MTRHPIPFTGTEYRHHMVGHTNAYIQQLSFSGYLIIGYRCFYHVTGTIHLVLVHICPPFTQSCQGVKGVNVSVGLLGRSHFGNPLVGFLLQSRIGMVNQRISNPFQCFIHIRIIKEDSGVFSCTFRRIFKVLNASGLVFNLVYTYRKCSRNMLFQAW